MWRLGNPDGVVCQSTQPVTDSVSSPGQDLFKLGDEIKVTNKCEDWATRVEWYANQHSRQQTQWAVQAKIYSNSAAFLTRLTPIGKDWSTQKWIRRENPKGIKNESIVEKEEPDAKSKIRIRSIREKEETVARIQEDTKGAQLWLLNKNPYKNWAGNPIYTA